MCWNGLEEFTDNSVDEEASASCEAPSSISLEPLHDEPSIRKWYRVSTVFSLASRKTEVAKYARGPRLQGLFVRRNVVVIKYFEQNSLVG